MDKQTIRNTAISAGAGVGTYYLVKNTGFRIKRKIMESVSITTPPDRVEILKKAADKILKNEGLENHGIKIVNAGTPEYIKETTNKSNAYFFSLRRKIVSTKNPIKKLILLRRHKFQKRNHEYYFKSLLAGTNGFYTNKPNNKNITINTKNGIHIFFHEASHAIDYTKPFLAAFFKGNKDKRLLRLPLLAVLGTALLTQNKKENPNKTNTSTANKIKSFVKDHCAILSTIGFLPMMACETSANFKGQLLGKKYAPADLKLLTKTHTFSLLSYWSMPLIAAISVLSANKVKDFVSEKLKNSDLKIWKS